MRSDISLIELERLGHFDIAGLVGQAIPTTCIHSDGKWHLFVPKEDGSLLDIIAEPVEVVYFAESVVDESDLEIPFLQFLYQHATWPEMMPYIDGIHADIRNFAASFSKLRLIFDHADSNGIESSQMVVTEIEYIFLTCRSVFDLLQEFLLRLWKGVRFSDEKLKRSTLPSSFRKIVMDGERPRSVEAIATKFGMPSPLAQAFADSAPFFSWLRAYRDLIAHSGRTPEYIYRHERGFAVSTERHPFKDMKLWCEENTENKTLGSLLSALSYVILSTLETCESIVYQLSRVIAFPPRLTPKLNIFLRGPHLKNLARMDELKNVRPWYS